jgi:L-ascorbate metabolism protein UlaG (beta-lactamase superfamily)
MVLPAFGGQVRDARLERVQSSPHFDGRRFRNAVPTSLAVPTLNLAWQYVAGAEERVPRERLPVVARPELSPGRGEPLEITWLGHSSVLVDIDGYVVLTDPVFGPRSGPVSWAGPKRFHPVPIAPESLPQVDAILVSHDHYDHLDYGTVQKLAQRDTTWITALGVGAHLEAWGVRPERIVELDWWQTHDVRGLQVVATPARHFQGRGPGTATATFWCGWAVRGPRHSVWFSGDTGPWDEGFSEIGERFGGFDVSMIEIGAWHPSWGTIHLGPENALRVHQQVRARTMMPVHWGTFQLALHAWDQPICQLLELAEQSGAQVLSPMMGETVHREAGVHPYWQARRRKAEEARARRLITART